MEAQLVGIAPACQQLVAQAILHGQGHLDAAGAGADDSDRGRPGMAADPCQQGQPAFVETPDRLDRHDVFACPGDAGQLRRRADVDRQGIVGYRRSIAAQHLACRPVDADNLVAVIARPGKLGQPAQVDMDVGKTVMAGDVARQHARIRRVGIGADHRQAHAGQRLHGKHVQHADVAMAAADQHDVSQHGAGSGFHLSSFQ